MVIFLMYRTSCFRTVHPEKDDTFVIFKNFRLQMSFRKKFVLFYIVQPFKPLKFSIANLVFSCVILNLTDKPYFLKDFYQNISGFTKES